MLYYVQTDQEPLQVEVTEEENGNLKVQLPSSQAVSVDLKAILGNKVFSVLIDGKSFDVHFEQAEEANQYTLTVNGIAYPVKVESERQHRLATLAPRSNLAGGDVSVKAPMPGLVTIVRVQEGDTVNQGDRLVVLEAMKMENELRAPRAGTIKTINVTAGQTVEQNKVLVVIE
jgi:biotin carboxyl carrier protein